MAFGDDIFGISSLEQVINLGGHLGEVAQRSGYRTQAERKSLIYKRSGNPTNTYKLSGVVIEKAINLSLLLSTKYSSTSR